MIGFNRLGIKTVLSNDVEPSCVRTLENFSFNKSCVDASICDKSWHSLANKYEPIDIVSGGFPCQSFSIAGAQEGFDDVERGTRFFDMMRFVSSLKHPPKVLFLENVANLRTYNEGQWMSAIVESIRATGYWLSDKHCMIINSADVSKTPQQRERLFIVAYHSSYFRKNYFDIDFSGVSTKKKELWSYIDRSARKESRLYLDPENTHYLMIHEEAENIGTDRLFQIRRGSVRAVREGICPTLTANMGGGGHNVPFVIDDYGIRRLTVDECLALQGYQGHEVKFPDGMADSAKLKMIGNSVNPDVVEIIAKRIVEDIQTYANRLAISA